MSLRIDAIFFTKGHPSIEATFPNQKTTMDKRGFFFVPVVPRILFFRNSKLSLVPDIK